VRLALLALLLSTGLVWADDLETLTKKQSFERAQVAHVKSRTVAVRELAAVLHRHADELRAYAETAPLESAALARDRAERLVLDEDKLGLELDPARTEALLARGDERAFTLLVQWASGESQEKLVSVLDARLKSSLCPEALRAKILAAAPGALVLEGAEARSLGASWGKVELILDRKGDLRGVDLPGDERQGLLEEIKR